MSKTDTVNKFILWKMLYQSSSGHGIKPIFGSMQGHQATILNL